MPMSTPTGATTLPLASCSATTRSMRGNIGSERKLSTDTFFIIGCLFGSSYYPGSLEACAWWTNNERTYILAEIAPRAIYLMPSQLVPGGRRDVHKNSLGHIRVRLRASGPADSP